MSVDPSLISNIELLCLDAGNVVIFLDHARLARLIAAEGYETTVPALIRAEGVAKIAIEEKKLVDVEWSHRNAPGGLGWGRMLATILDGVGFPRARLAGAIGAIWASHVELNLWSCVPDGLADSLHALRNTGARVAIVSNSEGMLDRLFKHLGVFSAFDTVVDSGVVGVEKPDPRIFEIAMSRCHATAETSIHLGDTFASDTLGARAVPMRTALVDVYGHMEGRHLDVPRVPSATHVANAITAARTKETRVP